jgi:hypothetical protein
VTQPQILFVLLSSTMVDSRYYPAGLSRLKQGIVFVKTANSEPSSLNIGLVSSVWLQVYFIGKMCLSQIASKNVPVSGGK